MLLCVEYVTNIFSFSHNGFYSFPDKFYHLTHSHTMTPWRVWEEAFCKHFGKRRNCLYKQFVLFPQFFLLNQRQKLSFLLHLIFRLQMLSVWRGPKFCHMGVGWGNFNFVICKCFQFGFDKLFSSPEHKVLIVSFCDRPMSVVHNFFKHLLLLNHWANLDETWQRCSLGEALPKLFQRLNSSH